MYAVRSGPLFLPRPVQQYANWRAHYETTGPEIIEQTAGRITHFVTLLGTSGTFIGNARRLRQGIAARRSASRRSPPQAFTASKERSTCRPPSCPAFTTRQLADRNLWIETEDCHNMVKRLAREEGLLVGISGGGNVVAALTIARELHAQGKQGVIVTILCDSADKYLSEHFWDED